MHLRYAPFLLLSGLLTACQHEKIAAVSSPAAAWLPHADGEQLRFRNDTLGVQLLTVRRSRSVATLPSKSADNPYELQTLAYASGGFPVSVLQLQAAYQYVSFGLGQPDGRYGAEIRLQTGPRDSAQAVAMRCRLLAGYTLRGRTYAQLLHARLLPTVPTANQPVTEFFYARDEGLVAYTTNRRQTWYRD